MPETPHRPRSAPRRRGPTAGYRPPAPSVRRDGGSEFERALTNALAVPTPAMASFTGLGLPQRLVEVLTSHDITAPFPIQVRTVPDALAGRDVLGRAQTGSGKTLAFALPVLARLAADRRAVPSRAPRALVLVPTRELARQVADEMSPLGKALGIRVVTVYGGAPINRQIEELRRGPEVVVATPGRLIDLLDRGAATLSNIEVTVLDEADHMADLGFLPAVTRLLDATPAGGQRLLFSATLDKAVERLVRAYLRHPAVHAVAPVTTPVEAMDHHVFALRPEDKVPVTAELAARPGRTLLFVRTKHGADRLARQLAKADVRASALHGNLNQNQRQRALDSFAAGSPRVLVATDVAARGIHVDDVDLVIHFDPPGEPKDYLHRSGRTARAGASGTVVSLVQPDQMVDMARLHEAAAVRATTTQVHVGHPVVRQLAESGSVVLTTRVGRARRTG
ncbi:MAG: DEAD/DEAH box helicase [Mycobacteriales bacterium]